MSILIKGMEMPKTCWDCACSNYYYHTDEAMCDITDETLDYILWKRERRSDCPLIEIPTPHGRLIDADRLDCLFLYDTSGSFEDGALWVLGKIDELPTIIEAERSAHEQD